MENTTPAERKSDSFDRTIQDITLNRLRFECEYYLSYGYRNPSRLLEHSERAHIDAMKALWESYPPEDKPEWLTFDQILTYEREMIHCPKHQFYAVEASSDHERRV